MSRRLTRFDGRTVKQHARSALLTARREGLDETDARAVAQALVDWLDWSGWTQTGGTYTGPDRSRIATFIGREIDERRTNRNLRWGFESRDAAVASAQRETEDI